VLALKKTLVNTSGPGPLLSWKVRELSQMARTAGQKGYWSLRTGAAELGRPMDLAEGQFLGTKLEHLN
jgi:hypothetical protein